MMLECRPTSTTAVTGAAKTDTILNERRSSLDSASSSGSDGTSSSGAARAKTLDHPLQALGQDEADPLEADADGPQHPTASRRSPLSQKAFKVHQGKKRSGARTTAAAPSRDELRRPRTSTGGAGEETDDDPMREIAALKIALAQAETEAEASRAHASKLSRENQRLRQKLEEARADSEEKDSRISRLQEQVQNLSLNVSEANEMERANVRYEEEQLRLEIRRLQEERDRAILERNELMSRAGMMTVEVVEGDVNKRVRLGPVQNKISKMVPPNLHVDLNGSSKTFSVSPEDLLWDSDGAE